MLQGDKYFFTKYEIVQRGLQCTRLFPLASPHCKERDSSVIIEEGIVGGIIDQL